MNQGPERAVELLVIVVPDKGEVLKNQPDIDWSRPGAPHPWSDTPNGSAEPCIGGHRHG